jgi:hypothetical protein
VAVQRLDRHGSIERNLQKSLFEAVSFAWQQCTRAAELTRNRRIAQIADSILGYLPAARASRTVVHVVCCFKPRIERKRGGLL